MDPYEKCALGRIRHNIPGGPGSRAQVVMMGWTGSPEDGVGAASQSLTRDLSLSRDYELLQQFVPEFKRLRLPGSEQHLELSGSGGGPAAVVVKGNGALRLEIVATFSWGGSKSNGPRNGSSSSRPAAPFGFSYLGGKGNVSVDCTDQAATGEAPGGCMVVITNSVNNTGTQLLWMPVLPVGGRSVRVHTIVDHVCVETIVNNRTAMVTYTIDTASAAETSITLFGGGAGGTSHGWCCRLDACHPL